MNPVEAEEAKTLVAYLRVKGIKFQHIPNETGSSPEAKRRAIRMKQQGTSAGFPDYLIVVNKQLIAIELKRRKGGTLNPKQREWLEVLAGAGVPSYVAHGADEAIEIVQAYLPLPVQSAGDIF